MAPSDGQQQPAQSPFKLFSRISWNKSGKKPKQGSFGEESNMYYHPELKRWVERGKEEEAEREAAGPPPPPVLSQNSITAGTSLSSKRSLSQRYVLQPNLSISSSMASLAGSLSQTDLPGLGPGESLSGPPSAIGSTAPSPPQSSNCLVPQGSFTSGPASATGLGTTNSFFVPAPPQRAVSQPLIGSSFVPPPPTPEESGPGEDSSAQPPADNDPQRPASPGQDEQQQPCDVGSSDTAAGAGDDKALQGSCVAFSREAHGNGNNVVADEPTDAATHVHAAKKHRASMQNGDSGVTTVAQNGDVSMIEAAVPAAASEGYEDAVSFPDTHRHLQAGSPVALSATSSAAGAPPLQPLLAREYRRLGGAAANASDGGAAISLHEGMGVAPVGHHYGTHALHHGADEAAVDSDRLAEEQGPASAVENGIPDLVQDGDAAVRDAAEPMANGRAVQTGANCGKALDAGGQDAPLPGEEARPTDPAASESAGGGQTLYSQYYYQQYAYLYQYAQDQGYTEGDAVAYAQYYAAVYAQQYEAQAPEGQLGETAGSEACVDGRMATITLAADERSLTSDAAGVGSVDAIAVEAVSAVIGPGWQAAAVAGEDEAPAVVLTEGQSHTGFAEAGPADSDNVKGAERSANPEVTEVDALLFSAAPLPADLTAAASAAAQHQQSAVTAAVVAAAAAVEQQQAAAASVLASADQVAVAPGAAAAQEASASAQSAAAALAPQLLLGKLGQLSSAATAAVASLGASVAATAPIAAALSAAASTAAAAAVTGGSFAGLEGGLSEDDFERIMHPGDPAKLDGPLPWELPEHLRTGRKFLALCANWHSANPGRPYAPQLLLQLEQPEQQQQQAVELAETAPPTEPRDLQLQAMEAVAANGGDVALAAEGGAGSAGGAAPAVAELGSAARAEEQLSSYERAYRLSEFGQPGAVLLTKQQETRPAQPPSENPTAPEPLVDPVTEALLLQVPTPQEHSDLVASAPNGLDLVIPAEVTSESTAPVPEPVASMVLPRVGTLEAVNFFDQLGEQAKTPVAAVKPHVDSMVASAATAEPAAEPVFNPAVSNAAAAATAMQSEPLAAPSDLPRLGTTEAVNFFEELGEQAKTPVAANPDAVASGAAPTDLPRLATVEATNFFEELGEQAKTTTGAKPHLSEDIAGSAAAATGTVGEEVLPVSPPACGDGVLDADVAAPAATAAAAAIDSVVQALEQLRSSAAAGDSSAVADPAAGTALLLQIQSSLAQATEALAGMGVDVSALATLAGAPATSPMEWTPSAGHKRPRVDASPATPTRVAALGTTSESAVVTPLLPPGPPMVRPTVEAAAAADSAAAAPGERFQQVGRRLSGACGEADTAQSLVPQQPVVVSITVAAAPDVDVAAVEERVRGEERTAWEARVAAVVGSEREAAALVIAAVERERDGLQQRVGDLEQALATAMAERDELLQKLDNAKGDATRAYAAEASAVSDRDALEAQLSELKAERGELVAQLAAERSEKAALAEALSSVRAESEELRRNYAERFSALNAELEATRGSLAELQGEHDELLLCLGQESTKVSALTDALRDAGGDPEPLVEQIEAEYENMGLGGGGGVAGAEDDDGNADGEESTLQVLPQTTEVDGTVAAEGWEGGDLDL